MNQGVASNWGRKYGESVMYSMRTRNLPLPMPVSNKPDMCVCESKMVFGNYLVGVGVGLVRWLTSLMT